MNIYILANKNIIRNKYMINSMNKMVIANKNMNMIEQDVRVFKRWYLRKKENIQGIIILIMI